jgi:hypothetical protein
MNKQFFSDKILAPLEEWSQFGEKINVAGTRLIGHAPHIALNAYVNVVYAPLSDTELQEFSEQLGRKIPDQFRRFLIHTNGLMVFSGAIRVMGFIPLHRKFDIHIYNYPSDIIVPNVSARVKGLSSTEVLVGFYKEDGSYVSIEECGRVVRFDAMGSGGLIKDWPDFDTWLSSEIAILNEDYKAGKVSVFIPSTTQKGNQ